jgi:hypothetical protein
MDLGAFLEPGLYLVYCQTVTKMFRPWGHVLSRPNRRLTWLGQNAPDAPWMRLRLEIPGFKLEPDGALSALAGEKASVHLLGPIRCYCFWSAKEVYICKFDSLTRVF